MAQKKWTVFKISCYLLLTGSAIWVFRFVKAFWDSDREFFSWLLFLFLAFFGAVAGFFQFFNLYLFEKRFSGEELLMKLDSWTHYLLLRGSFVQLALFLFASGAILVEYSKNWKNFHFHWDLFVFEIGVLLYTMLLLYNLITAIIFRKR